MTQYDIAAEMTGITWCPSSSICRTSLHNDWVKGVVHFSTRRQTKRGLYEFLVLAYGAKYGEAWPPRWRYLWMRSLWVQRMAADMHRRLPRSLFDEDRARVRELISKEDEWHRGDETRNAARWARKA